MNDLLAMKIRRAYPDGTANLDESALISDERDDRINNVLVMVEDECSLNVEEGFPFDKEAYQFMLTQKDHPPFELWLRMNNSQKLAWIGANHGEPYPVFWLKISRVADYYEYFYNHWVPRGNTGYLDIDCRRSPNTLWAGYEMKIRKAMGDNGFSYMTDELAIETVPFVPEPDYGGIPEDVPRWYDDAFEPPLVPARVHECLFGKW